MTFRLQMHCPLGTLFHMLNPIYSSTSDMASSTGENHLKFTSWNVKGLRSPCKRMAILRHLKRLRTDVALLQETHLSADDLTRLRKLWVGTVYGSPALGRKAGVAILVHKNLKHTLRDVRIDSSGRKMTLHLTLDNKQVAITNIYAPNSPDTSFFQDMVQWILSAPETLHLVGGDFNSVMSTLADRTGYSTHRTHPTSQAPDSTLLAQAIASMQYVDTWRLYHPTDREYTFFSPPHNSFSRIDYFFASPALINTLCESEILDARISDHSPISIHMTQMAPSSPSPIWRFPSYLMDNQDFQHTLNTAWNDYVSTNGAHITEPNLFWEAGKAFLRGTIISYTTQFKKHSKQQYRQASEALRTAHDCLTLNRTPDNIRTWRQAKCTF